MNDLEKRNKTLERRWKVLAVLAILFLVTRPVALYIVNKLIHKAAQSAGLNEYPLIDPARQFIPQKDYILNVQPLRNYLTDLGKKYPDNFTVYYEQLNSGANISINRDLRLFPASLIKIPMAIIAARKVQDGVWTWDRKLMIDQSDINSESGNLYKTVKPGDTMSVDDLLNALIVDSDNTAFHVFLRNFQQSDYDSFQEEVGLQDLFNEKGFVTSKEYSRILRVLWTSDYLERSDSQEILQLMAKATFHEFLFQGIPDGITFAHKYGENLAEKIYADSGIVYQDGHPFMLTVILKGDDKKGLTRQWAMDTMKSIAQKAIEQGNAAL